MSKQGKKKKNNHLSAERQRQSIALSIQDNKVYSIEKNKKIRRNILTVFIVAVIGVLITFVLEDESEEKLPSDTAVNQPVSDIVVQQGNKLTNVIASSKKPMLDTSFSELDEPDISELISNEIEIENTVPAEKDVDFSDGSELANNETYIEDEQEEIGEQDDPEPTLNGSGIESVWVSHIVAPGDTLAKIFRGKKLPLTDLYALAAIEGKDKPLSKILPNQELRFKLNASATLDALEILSRSRNIVFVRTSQGGFIRQQ